MASKDSKDDAAKAAKHIRTLAKAVAKSNADKKEAEAIWKASHGDFK